MQRPGGPRFTPVADHALLVSFAATISDAASAAVAALDRALDATPCAGLLERIPAMVSLLVEFDPLRTDHAAVQAHVQSLLDRPVKQPDDGRLHTIEVCYDEALAPDLAAVARATGLSADAVAHQHLQGAYRVRMYGFAPGFAYLSGVPAAIQVPRKTAAVRDIPAGSVIIAGPQCLITTLVMPTGWSVIGRSPARILRPDSPQPFLFEVGDRVRFVRIDRAQYAQRLEQETRDDGSAGGEGGESSETAGQRARDRNGVQGG
jgi:inhibitor of KinA